MLLRREFEVPAGGLEHYLIHVDYRGTYQVYINGVVAAEVEEDLAGSKDIIPFSDALKAIRSGRNVIAVRAGAAKDQGKERYISVRLSAARPLQVDPSARESHQAAWVVLSHVLLNLDETLTKR